MNYADSCAGAGTPFVKGNPGPSLSDGLSPPSGTEIGYCDVTSEVIGFFWPGATPLRWYLSRYLRENQEHTRVFRQRYNSHPYGWIQDRGRKALAAHMGRRRGAGGGRCKRGTDSGAWGTFQSV